MTSPDFVISDEAKGDLLSIEAYIGEHSGETRAATVTARLMEAIKLLAFMPGMGSRRPYLQSKQRAFSASPWTIFYRLLPEGGIEVIRVIDERRDLPVIFKKKKRRR